MDPSSPCTSSPGKGAWRCTPVSFITKDLGGRKCQGLLNPAELENKLLAASIKTLLGTHLEAQPGSEPRGQWAIEYMHSLSCSKPETEVLELLPSLPETSHMTLGPSILASANS